MPTDLTVAQTSDARAERARSARKDRYEALRVVWRETDLQRVAYCRRVVSDRSDAVGVHVSPDGHAGLSGVQTCGSVWACPVCSEKINAGRQRDLEAAIRAW